MFRGFVIIIQNIVMSKCAKRKGVKEFMMKTAVKYSYNIH